MFVSQSFGKNMSLYGERIGFLTGVSSDAANIPAIQSQLTIIVRAMVIFLILNAAWFKLKVQKIKK